MRLSILAFDGLNLFDGFFFAVQWSFICVHGFPEFRQFFIDLFTSFHGRLVRFILQGLTFDFQLNDFPIDGIDFRGHAVQFDPQTGSCLVDQIDGLVRQEAVADIAVGKGRRGDDGGILDPDAVMDFVAFLEPPEDGDGIFHGRLLDQNRLEASFQRRVLFDIFAVFIERCRPDAAQFAPGKGRFEHIGGVHGPFRGAGADDGVDFIDEEDDFPLGVGYFLEDGLQPFFEFAAVFGPGDKGADIEADNPFVLQTFRDIAVDDPLGQTFNNGGFADTGFTDEDGIVLRPPGEDLHDPPDFVIPADNGIEGPFSGQFIEISGIAFQGLIFVFRIGVRNPLVASNIDEDLEDIVWVIPAACQDSDGIAALFLRHGDAGDVRR